MSFFFEDLEAATELPSDIKVLHALGCKACPLDLARLTSPKMKPSGSSKPTVYILAEAPGETEDLGGEPLIGEAGTLLREYLPRGSAWDNKIRMSNTVRCRPTKGKANRPPTDAEVECCRPLGIADIEVTKPEIVLGLGAIALDWVVGSSDIKDWRGRFVPVRIGTHTCWFFCTYHPSYVLRMSTSEKYGFNSSSPLVEAFRRDLANVFGIAKKKIPKPYVPTVEEIKANLTLLMDCTDKNLKTICRTIKAWGTTEDRVTVDFETNRLRPYGSGKLLTASFSCKKGTIAFPVEHSQASWTAEQLVQIHEAIKWFWHEAPCVKAAFNLSFEMEWVGYLYGIPPLRAQRFDDPMCQAYCLDERRGLLSLDDVTQLLFGFNLKSYCLLNKAKLDSEPLDKVLQYNALDAKWTERTVSIYEAQLIDYGLIDVYDREQMRRVVPMVRTQLLGIEVDQEKNTELREVQQAKLDKITEEISSLKVAKEFESRFGYPLNPASPKHLVLAFQDILQRREGERNGKYSTDDETLKEIDHPLARLVSEFRTSQKYLSMYFEGLAPGGKSLKEDGLIHTVLNTMFTRTGRLSSEDPNIQNFPKREDSWVRSIIVPGVGKLFVSVDYGQIEVRVLGMASKDPTLVKMLWDRYDMHLEWAEKFARVFPRLLKEAGGIKELRSIAKNKIVFPLFYGSMPKSVARDLSVDLDKCMPLIDEFWDTFKGVAAWQKKIMRMYNENGYVECLTGRRRRYPLESNKIINTPIQGTASDIVVDAMTRLSEYSQESGKIQFQARFNIHDDLTFALPKDSLDEDVETIIEMMLHTNYKFVNVPLSVEVAAGSRWDNLEKIGDFFSDEWN